MLELAAIVGLAGWRVASLLVREEGPFRVFERVRGWAGVPEVGELNPRPFIGGVLSCMFCATVWTSGGIYLFAEHVALWPVEVLAAMGLAALVAKVID